MYCSKCGGLLNSEMKVCPNCGNVISTLESTGVNTAENSESFNQSSIANAANSDTIINTTTTVNTSSLEENAVVNNNGTSIAENVTTTETSINTNNASTNNNSQTEKQKFNAKKIILVFVSGIIWFVLIGIVINILGWILPDKPEHLLFEEEKTFDIRSLLTLFKYFGAIVLSFIVTPIIVIKEATKKNR